MQARATTLIGRPPDEVFAFIADPANDRRWRSYLVSSRGHASAVGDVVTQTYEARGQTKVIELEVTEFSPPDRLSYRYRGPERVRISLQCRPEDGGTRVSFSVAAELGGLVSLASGRIEAEALKIAHADLAALKQVLESVA